jgi:hypothetical protein
MNVMSPQLALDGIEEHIFTDGIICAGLLVDTMVKLSNTVGTKYNHIEMIF